MVDSIMIDTSIPLLDELNRAISTQNGDALRALIADDPYQCGKLVESMGLIDKAR